MDIRGIEVTNQLRSAIRAKLLELGVRYDEELPDYILVMVVNKKTRQQMYEDLCLFLEESTSPFVDWLHDQVLKKLQKVTVAKKKSSRDLVPTVIVKQEEEKKKKKSCPTSFLEDQVTESSDKISKVTKALKKTEKVPKPATIGQNTETDVIQSLENPVKKTTLETKSASLSTVQTSGPSQEQKEDESPKKVTDKVNYIKSVQTSKGSIPAEHFSKSSIEAEINVKISEISTKNSKQIPSDNTTNKGEPSSVVTKPLEKDEIDEESEEESSKKLKSSINKPRITSVVTVKNRLEFPTSRNKFDSHKSKLGFESRYRKIVKGIDKHEFEGSRRNDMLFSGRNNKGEDYFRKSIGKGHDFEIRTHESDRNVDIKSRLGSIRDEHSKDKSGSNPRSKTTEKLSNSIKDRLGTGNILKIRDDSLNKKKELLEESRSAKFVDKERPIISNSNLSIKSRLGPVKNVFKAPDIRRRLNLSGKPLPSSEDEDCMNSRTEDDTDDDNKPASAIGPVKSRIIAVKRGFSDRGDRKRTKMINDSQTARAGGKDDDDDDDDEKDIEDGKIASKVIVTPRPLKPLQPLQKRATQSLLLRAVAEANQSVVRQKNPEPVLTEKVTAPKRVPTSGIREGQNLSVRLNSSKRLVMEKIQVELTTDKTEIDNPEPYVPQPVTDEHMEVVMSLFQRSNDSQKFLVTLNGYNNNVSEEKGVSDEDERLEMEVNEDDDFLLANPSPEEYTESKTASNGFQLLDMEPICDDSEKTQVVKNSENYNTDKDKVNDNSPRKKRKMSPIIYNRSRSSSPVHTKPASSPLASVKNLDKQIVVDTLQPSVLDKSKDKCRYWPDSTLGIKRTYFPPTVLCSAFPACKFGEKCLYKHPKCKFGLSCTKLGCVYSHPPQQCKYHPYCTNPTCAYTHPLPQVQPVEVIHRAKFTWRKHE